jgi:hypothetical protein
MPWFYRYKADGVSSALAGPFDTEEDCLLQRTQHDQDRPKDECGMPEDHPEGYQHEFYNAKNFYNVMNQQG